MRAHDLAALSALYDDRVFLYGLPMSRVAAMSRLDHVLRTTADYTQTIAHATVEEADGGDVIRITFTKNATAQGKTSTVSAYLVLRRTGGGYRIVEESDTTTDAAMTSRTEKRYPDECRRAIGAALDELWATRVGPSALQSDGWYECPTKGHQCVGRHWVPPSRERWGKPVPMIVLDVDLATGALRERDAWASSEGDLTMAAEVQRRITESCRAAKVYGHDP